MAMKKFDKTAIVKTISDPKELLNFFKKNYIPVCIAVVVLTVGIVILSLLLSGGEEGTENSDALQNLWGSGLTEGLPAFSEEYENIDVGEGYVAAYYEGVSSEKVGEYAKMLEKELAVEFSKDKYPYVAECEDKFIVLHYNVTEMRFSITVTEKTNTVNN